MDTNLALLLLLAPFAGFLLNVFFGKKLSRNLSGTLGTLAVAVSFVVTTVFFLQVNSTGEAIMVN
ncbi:MAG TPA: NADH-quinone oxidoreductase subunit L, partial [Flavobacterium sp.]|nr:NADH-quinone oxidoreductase subunit L [Flavobacterium sp.]